MKKITAYMFFFFFAYSLVLAYSEHPPCSCGKLTSTPSQIYFMCKEIISFFCVLPWIDEQLIKTAKVFCIHCSHEIAVSAFYIHLVWLQENKKITLLKRYLWNKNVSDLEHFMCYTLEKLKYKCPSCKECSGWHVAHPELVENSSF